MVISSTRLVIETTVVAYGISDYRTHNDFRDECEMFKMDYIMAEVASVSCTYDYVLFCDLLNDYIALLKHYIQQLGA